MTVTYSATSPSSVFDALVFAHLRHAHVRARLILNRVEAAKVALAHNWIDGEGALGMIAEVNLLDFVVGRSS